MTNNLLNILHVGLVIDESAGTYTAHLINPTLQSYANVRILTGAFCGDEDSLIQTSRTIRNLGELKTDSAILLETGEIDDLDFVIWFQLDLTPTFGGPLELWSFSLPKYHWLDVPIPFGYRGQLTTLPIINQQGYAIHLSPRFDGVSIEAEWLASIPAADWGHKTLNSTLRVEQAKAKATELHKGQKRKAIDVPYIIHPINVATILSGYTTDEDVIAAGFLHDTLEDCDYSLIQLWQEFGEVVARIVSEVTEDVELKNRLGSKASWIERKQKYLEHLQSASQEALLVAAADKIDNLNMLRAAYSLNGAAIWEVFNASPEKQLWFYDEIISVLRKRLDSPIIEDLELAYRKARPILIE